MFIIGMAGVVKRPVGGYYGSSSSGMVIEFGYHKFQQFL